MIRCQLQLLRHLYKRQYAIQTGMALMVVALCHCLLGITGAHFFPAALAADLVVFPATAFLVVSLMTPTATVCLMSLTANLPSGAYWEKASTTIGFCGISSTMAASWDLMDCGASSVTLPLRLSTFALIL